MNPLISTFDMGRIEETLTQRRSEIVQATSWIFNIVLLVAVLSTFGYFLYVQYETHKDVSEYDHIPFEPQVWHSATRNVRSEEYGHQLQPFEIEARHGLP